MPRVRSLSLSFCVKNPDPPRPTTHPNQPNPTQPNPLNHLPEPQPENLLLTDGGTKLRITDLGCALDMDKAAAEGGPVEDGLLVDTAGTFTFLAPECCTGEPYSPWPADVWAAAVTLYCFLFGRLPFQRDGVSQLFTDIQEAPLRFPEPTEEEPSPPPLPSPGLAELIAGLFDKEPSARWTLDRVRAHAWLEAPRVEDEEEDRRKAESGVGAEEAAAKAAAVAAGKGKGAQV
jgi:serine/threonine protein kinase